MEVFFLKCIWEIRTDNPSLAVKILNVTPRPILPNQKGLVGREREREREREKERERAIKRAKRERDITDLIN